jgi:hypothetical protein
MKDQSMIEDRYRSLLQKAVRRGNIELVYTASALIESLGGRSAAWLEARTAVIMFAECWPLGAELLFTKPFHSKVAALLRVARREKARDATGLGFLAYALDQGDDTVLSGVADDKAVRLIARAIRQPAGFWSWISEQPAEGNRKSLIENALRYREGERPHDKAVVQAAAYLALTSPPPKIEPAPAPEGAFPYWVVFDRHTAEGKRALRDVARDLHMPLPLLEWSLFYYEGAIANADAPSPWWQQYCRWHFERLGMPPAEAHLLWEPAREQIIDALAEDSQRLQSDMYRWKLGNLERIGALKRQVELFASHIKEVQHYQSTLF